MGSLRRPSERELIEYMLRAAELPLNHVPGEIDEGHGFDTACHSVTLGRGRGRCARASARLFDWSMVPQDYVDFYWPQRPVAIGTTVAVGVWTLGLYWLNPCRITEVTVPTCDAATSECGEELVARVVWETVEGHGLVGRQRFSVFFDGRTGDARYEIAGTAQPLSWLRVNARAIRLLREEFARRSCAAMQRSLGIAAEPI